jgi:hypothetical protein
MLHAKSLPLSACNGEEMRVMLSPQKGGIGSQAALPIGDADPPSK